MTAKLVLHRPENALQYMIDWCKDMQIRSQLEATKIKMLYDESTKDDDSDHEELKPPMAITRIEKDIPEKFGNDQLSVLNSRADGDTAADKEKVAKEVVTQLESRIEEGQGEGDETQPQVAGDQITPPVQVVTPIPVLAQMAEVLEESTLISEEAEVSVSEASEDTISELSSENGSEIIS